MQIRQVKLLGFVEELILDKDPEYHWSDNFRSSRLSNEERQRTFLQLSGAVRRVVGRKVLGMVRPAINVEVCCAQEPTIDTVPPS